MGKREEWPEKEEEGGKDLSFEEKTRHLFCFLKKTVNHGNGTTIKMAVNEHFNFIPLSI